MEVRKEKTIKTIITFTPEETEAIDKLSQALDKLADEFDYNTEILDNVRVLLEIMAKDSREGLVYEEAGE